MQQITRKKLIGLYSMFSCHQWKIRIKAYLDNSVLELDSHKITLKEEDIKYAINNADVDQKQALKKAGVNLVDNDPLNKINKIEQVWKALDLNPKTILPYDESKKLTKKQKSANAFIKINYISNLFNGDWKPKFDNTQNNYYCWFRKIPSGGWVFDGVGSYCFDCGDLGSGFYFKDQQTAKYIGETFIDIFNDYLSE